GGNNGSACAVASGGTGSGYTYSFDGGSFTSSSCKSSLSAGSHTVAVKDGIGQIVTKTFSVTQPPALIASTSVSPILCNGGTAVITVSASGGTPAYSGIGTFTVTAGTYTYTVT